jgi:hypothetical protein
VNKIGLLDIPLMIPMLVEPVNNALVGDGLVKVPFQLLYIAVSLDDAKFLTQPKYVLFLLCLNLGPKTVLIAFNLVMTRLGSPSSPC